MKLVITTVIIVLIAGILVYFYARLGGFNPIETSLVTCTDFKLMGKMYRGTPQDSNLPETFKEVEGYKKEKGKGELFTIYDTEPAGKLDTLQLFVGLEHQKGDPIPQDWITVTIPCDQAVLASVSSHRLVMPSPKKVKTNIVNFAKNNHFDLEGDFIEKLINDRNVEILAPVQPTN